MECNSEKEIRQRDTDKLKNTICELNVKVEALSMQHDSMREALELKTKQLKNTEECSESSNNSLRESVQKWMKELEEEQRNNAFTKDELYKESTKHKELEYRFTIMKADLDNAIKYSSEIDIEKKYTIQSSNKTRIIICLIPNMILYKLNMIKLKKSAMQWPRIIKIKGKS
jgi:hypothetical protein